RLGTMLALAIQEQTVDQPDQAEQHGQAQQQCGEIKCHGGSFGSREWGMENGEWSSGEIALFPFPTPYSPFPAIYPLSKRPGTPPGEYSRDPPVSCVSCLP